MDHWNLAIDRNRKALVAIAAGLVGLVLCGFSAKPSGLPSAHAQASRLNASSGAATEGEHISHNRGYVSRVLRAAEAALRRLIVIYMKAYNLTVPAPKPCNRPLPDFTQFRRNTDRAPVFRLFDPRKKLVVLDGEMVDFSSASPSGSRPLTNCAAHTRKACSATEGECQDKVEHSSPASEPRIWTVGTADWYSTPSVCSICGGKRGSGFDQSLRGSRSKCDQHLCHCMNNYPPSVAAPVEATSRDACARTVARQTSEAPSRGDGSTDVLAEKHLRRLQALNHALKTIPKQAIRLAKIMAQREHAKPGPGAIPPIRPGIPPGLRRSRREKIDDVLSECHGLIRDMELPPI